jgi:glycerophosphoryl diester phosphodiesterase
MKKRKKAKEKKYEFADCYAHRGFHNKENAPENSMAAFRLAKECGLSSEIDVHRIADGSLVVFHDDNLERMTGAPGRIADYDIESLSKLRLAGTDEPIPSFDEVLDLYEDSGLKLLIELKVDRGNHRELAAAVADRLSRYEGEFAVQSFDPRAVREFRKNMPGVALGLLTKNYFNRDDGVIKTWIAKMSNLVYNRMAAADFASYKFNDKKNRLLQMSINRRGMWRLTWTLRTPEAYKAAVAIGCIPIFEGFDPREIEEDGDKNEE